MPRDKDDQEAYKRAMKDKKEGKAPTTQAGEFVKEEFDHVREGKHGAANPSQAIAIGLSKARRAGIDLPPPKKGRYSEGVRKRAERVEEVGDEKHHKVNPKRSKAVEGALKREPKDTASHEAISKHSKEAAKERSPKERSQAAKKAAETKGPKERSEAAKKAAKTKGPKERHEESVKAAETRKRNAKKK